MSEAAGSSRVGWRPAQASSRGEPASPPLGRSTRAFLHLAFGKVSAPKFRTVDAGTEIYRYVYWRVLVRYEAGWIGGGGNKLSRAQSLATPPYAQAIIAHVWSDSSVENPVDRLAIVPASGIGFLQA